MASDMMIATVVARLDQLQRMFDDLDVRVAALVENVNLLRGDAQRVQAEEPVARRRRNTSVVAAD